MRNITANKSYRSLLAGISLFLVFLLLLAACGSTNTRTTPTPSLATQADAFLNQRVANHAFSGVVQVTQGGKVLFSKSYGMADWEQQMPNTLNTKFRIGS